MASIFGILVFSVHPYQLQFLATLMLPRVMLAPYERLCSLIANCILCEVQKTTSCWNLCWHTRMLLFGLVLVIWSETCSNSRPAFTRF